MSNNKEEFESVFIKYLLENGRSPSQVQMYCKPHGSFGFKIKMCNGSWRMNSFNLGKKEIRMEPGTKIAPIIFFDKLSSREFNRILILEGESDALSLSSFTNLLISMPGANTSNCFQENINIIKEYLPSDHYEFCILFDNDLAGQKGGRELEKIISVLFPNSQVAIFDWDVAKSKDVREAFLSGELDFESINYKMDLQFAKIKTSHILSEIVQPEKLIKCPLDYDESTKTLIWLFDAGRKKIAFESGNKITLNEVADSHYSFLDPAYANSLEHINTQFLQNLDLKSWNDHDYFKDLNKLIAQYVSSPEENIVIASCYVVLSFMYPIFRHIPYLYLNGSKGSGKSTLSELISLVSFNGEHFACPTPASVRRLIHNTRGLISIDDAENLSSSKEENQTFISQLNSGYVTKAVTMLCSGPDNKQEKLFIGGPKVFNSIKGLESVLSSRTFFLKMKYAENLKLEKLFDKTNQIVKDYRCRGVINALFNHQKIKVIYNSFDMESSRESDIILPLLSIAKFFDDTSNTNSNYQNLVKKAFNVNKELKKEKWSFDMCLVNALYDIWNTQAKKRELIILNADLKDALGLYHDECIPHSDQHLRSLIGETLNALDLVLRTKRTSNHTSRKSTEYQIKVELLEHLYKRLIPEDR